MSHEESIELLPWLVNHSLSGGEREAVQAHAKSCIICRRELAELEALQQAVEAVPAEMPSPDMRRINARIDAQLERESRARNLLEGLSDLFASPWRVAFAAQSLALVAVATLWLQAGTGEPEFRTLTTTASLPSGHYLRVVFDPTLEQEAIDALLADIGLGLAAGPTGRGVVTLRFADELSEADRASMTDVLQNDPRVLFLQPVAAGN
jgi:hypothetical protein